MPRGPVVDKRVKGVKLTQTQFKKLILEKIKTIEALHAKQGVRAREVADAFGDPAWIEPDNLRLISLTLNNMKNRKVLTSVERGVFTHGARAHIGPDTTAQIEDEIVDLLEEAGGFMRRRDILERFDAEPESGAARQITTVLSRSEVINHDFPTLGFYNLPMDQIAAMPLLGKWARLLYGYGVWITTERPLTSVRNIADNEAIAFFENVGYAFKRALKLTGIGLDEAMEESKTLRSAIRDLIDAYPLRPELLSQVTNKFNFKTGEAAQRMLAEGATYDEIETARTEARIEHEADLPYILFDRFCDGEEMVHVHAPMSFYSAFAKWAGLDAAALSRGMLFWDVDRTRRPVAELIAKLPAEEREGY